MKPNQEHKTIHYYRAVDIGRMFDLQSVLAPSLKKYQSLLSTQLRLKDIKSPDRVLRIQNRKVENDGTIFLHVISYVPGSKASTVTPNQDSKIDSEYFQTPQLGREFKDRECFLRVSESDIIFLSSGISMPKVRSFLLNFINRDKNDEDRIQFSISKSFNVDIAKYIHVHGIKNIELNANAYEVESETFGTPRENLLDKALREVNTGLSALLDEYETEDEQKARENLAISIGINVKGNTRASLETRDFAEKFAIDTLLSGSQSDSNIAFVTGNNKRITPEGITHSRKYYIEKAENALDVNSAWENMNLYYYRLVKEKAIEVD